MARELKTTIAIGGRMDASLTTAARASQATLTQLADKAEAAERRLGQTRAQNALKARQQQERAALAVSQANARAELSARTEMDRTTAARAKAALSAQQTAEKAALSAQQLTERTALSQIQTLENQAAEEKRIARESAEARTAIEREQAEERQRLYDAEIKKRQKTMKTVTATMGKVGTAILKSVGVPLLMLGTAAVKTYTEFDDSMRQVQATLGISGDELSQLSDAARQMGSTTRYSASEAAQAILSIGQAGNDTAQTLAMLPTVLQTAQASGLSVDTVAEYVSQTVSTLGIGQDYIDDWADQVNKTASSAAVTQQQIFDATLTAGASAKALKGGTVELLTMVGILGNAGVQGSEAGRTISAMMNKLSSAPSRANAAAMLSQMNIEITDAQGNFREMNDIMLDFQKGMAGMGNAEKTSIMQTIFGEEYASKALALVNGAGDAWTQMSDTIAASAGTTEQMAETMEGGLGGSLRDLKSALEEDLIVIGEKLEPVIRWMSEGLRTAAAWFSELDGDALAFLGTLVGAVVAGGALMKFIGKIGELSEKLSGAAGSSTLLSGALNAIKIPSALPYIAFAVAVGAMAAALESAYSKSIADDVRARFGELVLTQAEIDALVEAIHTQTATLAGEINDQWDELKKTYELIEKGDLDLTIKMHVATADGTLTEDEITELQGAYEQWTNQVYAAIGATGGTAKISVSFALSGDTDEGTSWAGKISDYYGGLQDDVAEYAEMIDKEFQKGLAGGEIDTEAVVQYQEKIAEIYRRLQQHQQQVDRLAYAEQIKSGQLSYDSLIDLSGALSEALEGDRSDISEMYARSIAEIQATGAETGTSQADIDKAVETARANRDVELAKSTGQMADIFAGTVAESVEQAFPEIKSVMDAAGGFDFGGWMSQYGALQSDVMERDLAHTAPEEYISRMEALAKGYEQMQTAAQSIDWAGFYPESALGVFDDLGGDEALKEYTQALETLKAAGEEVPEGLESTIEMMQNLKALGQAGGWQGTLDAFGQNLNILDDLKASMQSAGTDGADGLKSGLDAGKSGAQTAGTALGATAVNAVRTSLSGISGVVSDALSSAAQSLSSGLSSLRASIGGAGGTLTSIPRMAEGGTLTSPTVVEVAEAGYAETIVPHTATPRSRMLLAEAAAGVGAGLGGGMTVTFSPQIIIQGGDEDAGAQVESAMPQIEAQFEKWFERMMARQRMVSYG